MENAQPVSIYQDNLVDLIVVLKDNAAQSKPKNLISLLVGGHNCLNWNMRDDLCLDITKYCEGISHSKNNTCIKYL